MFETLNTIASFIIALGVLVFVHELGHFAVAKWAGIKVERFSVGYPPKIFGFTYGETEYCISWVPFGGYVKVAGMADVGNEETSGEPWEFPSKPIGVRMAVIAAGPIMNFLFAFVALVFLFNAYGIETFESTRVTPQDGSIAIERVHHGHNSIQTCLFLHLPFSSACCRALLRKLSLLRSPPGESPSSSFNVWSTYRFHEVSVQPQLCAAFV